MFLSVSLYSVGRHKYKAKASREAPQRAMRRWAHNDGNDHKLYDLLSSLSAKGNLEALDNLRKAIQRGYQLCELLDKKNFRF